MPDPGIKQQILKEYSLNIGLSALENAIILTSSGQLSLASSLRRRSTRRQYAVFTKSACVWAYFSVCAAQTNHSIEEIWDHINDQYMEQFVLPVQKPDSLDRFLPDYSLYTNALRSFSGLKEHKNMNDEEILSETNEAISLALARLEDLGLIVDPVISNRAVIAFIMGLIPVSFNYQTTKGHNFSIKYSAALADIEYKGGDNANIFTVDLRVQKIISTVMDGLLSTKQRNTRHSEND